MPRCPSVGTARVLFSLSGLNGGRNFTLPNYDVAPDGQSFVMVRNFAEPPTLTYINIVLSFFDLLEELVPTDGSQ